MNHQPDARGARDHIQQSQVHHEAGVSLADPGVEEHNERNSHSQRCYPVDRTELRPPRIIRLGQGQSQVAEGRAQNPEARPDQRKNLEPPRGLAQQIGGELPAIALAGSEVGRCGLGRMANEFCLGHRLLHH